MKKLLTIVLILTLAAGLCSCKARTGYSEQPESKKGAREVSEIPEDSSSSGDESGQSKSRTESKPEPETDTRPEELTAAMLAAAQTGEKDKIQPYVDYATLLKLQEGQNAERHFKQLLAYMKWEILSSEVDGDRAMVSTKITNIDMAVVLPKYFQQAMELEYSNAISDEPLDAAELEPEYLKLFGDLLAEHKSGVVEKLVDIELEKSGDDWKIKLNDGLGDAMLGGYLTARSAIAGAS